MNNYKIIGALIGLAGAVENNGKTEDTDNIIWSALLSNDGEDVISAINKEKYRISPNCVICKNPCGNTSEYDMEEIQGNSPEIYELKMKVISELEKTAERMHDMPVTETVFKALYSLKYELNENYYMDILEELKK